MASKRRTRGKPATERSVETADPRADVIPTAENLAAALESLRAVLARLSPAEPPHRPDLVDAMLHILFADGLPCGVGQAALHRIATSFVDRNEFRVTEAYETAELLGDLGIPDLFARCTAAKDSVAEIYNDQNDVSLELLREATVADRNSLFARLPAIPQLATRYLVTRLSFEELLFSERSTLRVQQRLGLDTQAEPAAGFVNALREALQPFGCIPIDVAPPGDETLALASSALCPGCVLARLGRK